MIVREREIKNRFKAKGILTKIDDVGLYIEDEKEGTVDVLGFDEMKAFVDRNISFSLCDVVKEDMGNK